jgi:hypothetical protein
MPNWLIIFLAFLFLVHWIAFTRLAVIHRQLYYWLLSLLFLLLTSSFTTRLLLPGLEIMGKEVYLLLRYTAWALAVVTIPMMIYRIRKRRASLSETKKSI